MTCLTRGSSVCRGVTGEAMYWATGAALAAATILNTLSPTGCCRFWAFWCSQSRNLSLPELSFTSSLWLLSEKAAAAHTHRGNTTTGVPPHRILSFLRSCDHLSSVSVPLLELMSSKRNDGVANVFWYAKQQHLLEIPNPTKFDAAFADSRRGVGNKEFSTSIDAEDGLFMTWQLPRHVAHPTTVAISVSQLEQNTTLSPIFIKTSEDEQTKIIWRQQRQQTITCSQDFQQITWTSELRFSSQDSWNPNKKN
jgi:hypothetical protein